MSSATTRIPKIHTLPLLPQPPPTAPSSSETHLINALSTYRLHALQTSPAAYASTYEEEFLFPASTWRDRLSNPKVVHYVATLPDSSISSTKSSNASATQSSEMQEAEWIGFLTRHARAPSLSARTTPSTSTSSISSALTSTPSSTSTTKSNIATSTTSQTSPTSPTEGQTPTLTCTNPWTQEVLNDFANKPTSHSADVDTIPHFHFNGMFVSPSARGCGVGEALIRRAIFDAVTAVAEVEESNGSLSRDNDSLSPNATAESGNLGSGGKGGSKVLFTIVVDADNEGARRLYERVGFVGVRVEKYRPKPREGDVVGEKDALFMEFLTEG